MKELNEDGKFRQRMRTFKLRETKGGHLSIWERGGMHKSVGKATLIATPKGKRPVAMMVNLYDEPNGRHALVQVHKDFIIAYATVEYGTEHIGLYLVKRLHRQKKMLDAILVNEFYHGEWMYPLEERFEKIVQAMHKILATRDCVEPVFVEIPQERMESIEQQKNKIKHLKK